MENCLKENVYLVTDNGEVVDRTTGEVISLEEVKKAKKKKVIEQVEKANQELKELGMDSSLLVCEYKGEKYNCISVKPKHQFDKMFRTSMQEVIKHSELSLTARTLLLTLIPFIVFPSNMVCISGYSTVEEIGELSGLKPSTTYKAFKELSDKEIIHKTKLNGNTLIYINPFLISSGLIVEKSTVDYFINSRYAK